MDGANKADEGRGVMLGGCVIGAANNARIVNLEIDVGEIKADYKSLCKKIDVINSNINKLLGGVAVACILLVINIIIVRGG
jgi:hypothetical protein